MLTRQRVNGDGDDAAGAASGICAPGPGSAEHIVDSGVDHHGSVAHMAVSTQRPRGAGVTMRAAVGHNRKRAAHAFYLERPLQKPAFGRILSPPTS
ncbi:MAG: hypothetical protein P3B76_09595 [Gemmatimonadota bacterium]|nr:hypothetical protein [Gemmatimonadota bacterium]MDQ8168747.1 hypothetical protein [Gemmatimonadota bacterium]MDQ8172922.1 hypothetical protein [Gemmatimonadota bacterium]